MGGTDLFLSKWNSKKNDWDEAVNLGFPINTYKEESSILVSPNGKLAYFASDRKEGFGELDLYSFSLPESVKPEKITYFKGVVFDAKTQELLSAQFELIELETGNQLAFSVSDRVDGSFLLTLNLKRDYILNVSRPGYLFYSDQFLLQKEYSTSAPLLKDIPLQAIGLGEKMILKNIFFDTDKADLKRNSEIELGKLVLFLNLNPDIHIEIMGHTDHVGTAEYNKKLSTQRAKAVFDFLVNHQIASSRMTYKGFGWEKPMADNETEAGRAQNRRTEFVVTKI
jgi:outer membrane protein OmpA-like peptidoglycan-associated protein